MRKDYGQEICREYSGKFLVRQGAEERCFKPKLKSYDHIRRKSKLIALIAGGHFIITAGAVQRTCPGEAVISGIEKIAWGGHGFLTDDGIEMTGFNTQTVAKRSKNFGISLKKRNVVITQIIG